MKHAYPAGRLLAVITAILFTCPGIGSPALADTADKELSLLAIPRMNRVPLTRQATDHTCGVASLQAVLYYYGLEVREDQLALDLGTTPDGTPYTNIVSYAESKGFEVSTYTDLTLHELRRFIDERHPVLLPLQAWMNPPIDWSTYADGHYVVAVGYDRENVIFMDPSTLGQYTYIPNAEFLERWHDLDETGTKLIHFGIVMVKKDAVRYKPRRIVRMN